MKSSALSLSLILLAFCAVRPARAELPPLIPRDVLFGNPERTRPSLSPDGARLAWIAPDKKNVLQVWVKTIGKDDDKMVTADKKRGIPNISGPRTTARSFTCRTRTAMRTSTSTVWT